MTKNLKLFLCYSLGFILLASCQGKSSSKRIAKEPKAIEMAKELKVACVDQQNCSASVGNFVGYQINKNLHSEGYQVFFGNCTASLINETTVITNRHCFLNKVAKAGDSCENIFVKFPKVREYPEHLAECKQILFRPDIHPTDEMQEVQNLDVAIVQLKNPVPRPILRTSTEGFKNNETAIVHRFTTEKEGSFLETLKCPVIQDAAASETMRLAAHTYSAFVYLGDCPIIESNSGSPILNEQGLLKGVISFAVYANKVQEAIGPAAKDLKNGAGGINLACVNSPLINPQGVRHEMCEATLDWSKQNSLSINRLNELEIYRPQLLRKEDFFLNASKEFAMTYTAAKEDSFSFLDALIGPSLHWFSPSCAKNIEQLKDFYESQQTIPLLEDEIRKFDQYGRLEEKVNILLLIVKEIEVVQLKNLSFELKISGSLLDENKTFIQEIPLCEK